MISKNTHSRIKTFTSPCGCITYENQLKFLVDGLKSLAARGLRMKIIIDKLGQTWYNITITKGN